MVGHRRQRLSDKADVIFNNIGEQQKLDELKLQLFRLGFTLREFLKVQGLNTVLIAHYEIHKTGGSHDKN